MGAAQDLPVRIGLMVLTVLAESEAVAAGRSLIRRAVKETSADESRAIIELVSTIISYKFDQLSWREIHNMLDISVKETRIYKEIREEERQEGRQEGRLEGQARIIVGLLRKRFGELPATVTEQISKLSSLELEAMSEAIFDFVKLSDVTEWIKQHDS